MVEVWCGSTLPVGLALDRLIGVPSVLAEIRAIDPILLVGSGRWRSGAACLRNDRRG